MLLDRIRIRELGGGEPPLVGGYTPLGCALAYRPDPATFLTRMVRDVGSVFTLDLAGLKMTIVADPELLGQVHLAPEAVLSARSAQAELGFDFYATAAGPGLGVTYELGDTAPRGLRISLGAARNRAELSQALQVLSNAARAPAGARQIV